MEPLLVEFPITKVLIVPGNPDTIMFQTNMVASHIDVEGAQQLPVLIMTVPQGAGEKYVREELQIPDEYVTIAKGVPTK